VLHREDTGQIPAPLAETVDASPLTVQQIHQQVLLSFAAQRSTLPELVKRVAVLDERIEKSMSVSDIKSMEIERSHAQREIKDISEGNSERYYQERANKLLGRHSMLASDDHSGRAERLSNDYLCLASQYVSIRTSKEKRSMSRQCSYCGADIGLTPTDGAGVKACRNPACGFENNVVKTLSASPKEYDVWGNFMKAYRRFTGATKLNNIAMVMQDLDRYFAAEKKPSGEYYRRLPLNEIGRKDGTSHETILKAFEFLGYETYYKNYMYVCHRYYGWELPSLDHLLGAMEENFKRKQEVWKRIAGRDRQGKSSIPTEIRLCMELNHVGYRCDISWFNVTDRPETLEKHFTTYLIMYQGAGFELPHP